MEIPSLHRFSFNLANIAQNKSDRTQLRDALHTDGIAYIDIGDYIYPSHIISAQKSARSFFASSPSHKQQFKAIYSSANSVQGTYSSSITQQQEQPDELHPWSGTLSTFRESVALASGNSSVSVSIPSSEAGILPLQYYLDHVIDEVRPRINQALSGLLSTSSEEAFMNACSDESCSVVLAHRYPSLRNAENRAWSFENHYDAGTYALIHNTLQNGKHPSMGILEIFLDGQWWRLDPKPNNVILVVGRTLEYWTNGYFQAPLHRVRNVTSGDRYSIVYFNNCNNEAEFEMSLDVRGVDERTYNKDTRLEKVKRKHDDFGWYRENYGMKAVDVMAVMMYLRDPPGSKL